MMAVRRSDDGLVKRRRADRIFARALDGHDEQIAVRCDYKSAIDRLRRAVDPSRLLIAYYEDIFDGTAMVRICDFLGITYVEPNLAKKIHVGQPLKMRDEQRVQAREWLTQQYDYVRDAVGKVPAAWQYELIKVQA